MDTDGPGNNRVTVSWLRDSRQYAVVTGVFLSAIHDDYPSHGDIMEGRAENSDRWVEDLAEVHAHELAEVDLRGGLFDRPGIRVAMAEEHGQLVGFAMVAHVAVDVGRRQPVVYARLDDIVVAPGHQGLGIGTALVSWVESELVKVSVTRVFLESGIRNTRAHKFFNRHGYTTTSVTMMKDLTER